MPETIKHQRYRYGLYRVIFLSDSPGGRLFDVCLMVLILLSILAVMLESIPAIRKDYGAFIYRVEWFFTIVFTVEYLFRIYASPRRLLYLFSFLGLIDFLAIIPTYLIYTVPDAQTFVVVRAVRLLRVYRVLKLYRFIRAGNVLLLALRSSLRKISIFMLFLLVVVILLGSLMYVVEDGQNGFYSIPLSIYWAIITLTTVGYGDIVPVTYFGKFIASFIMLLGYSIIAIPTGIVSAELVRGGSTEDKKFRCSACHKSLHDRNAVYCSLCGTKLDEVSH